MSQTMKIWRLKRGADRRMRSGHPWAYSNELQVSPKGVAPGEKLMLFDAAGKFLAHGYGNAASLIAFRAVSREEADTEWDQVPALAKRLKEAWDFRVKAGIANDSFRWIFGEGDGFPGLILDAYRVLPEGKSVGSEKTRLVVVLQAHSAGIDRIVPNLLQAIEEVAHPDAVVLRNDVSHRKLEGLPIEEPKVLGKLDENGEWIRVRSADPASEGKASVAFKVDLIRGQKTGFFLDQAENIRQFIDLIARASSAWKPGAKIRILDLCCYVGQWSTQISAALKSRGFKPETLLVDASARALSFAKANVEAAGGHAEVLEADVLADLPKLTGTEFDIVICDPPALIPGRKDIPTGSAAYLKLNTEAFRLLAPGGWMVTCSCSQLLEEEVFSRQVSRASVRNSKDMRWLARGTQALDHPLRLEFNEGKYLKMWIGRDAGV
jgi:23S rRNA (cytosine1962-C5)-methyltransferase